VSGSEHVDEYEVALRVARALEAVGVEYTLGGSLASSLQGDPRSTNDVDFAVRLEERHVELLAATLGDDFDLDEQALREAIRSRGSYNIFFLPSVMKVDLFVRGGEPFDESELARRTEVTIRDGRKLFVATPEDNLLRKLWWYRMGGEVSDRQWRDILGILRASAKALDREYAALWAPRLGVADLLERAIAQA
jgi:hypothetical protein